MKIITGALVGLVLLGGCSSGTEVATPTPSPTFVVPTSPAPVVPTPEPEPVQAEPEPTPLSPDDFEVEVKTLSKQCFGSAGCSVDVRILLSSSKEALDETSGEVTIEVTGDESGPIIETIAFDGRDYTPAEISLSPPKASTKITATITDVTES